MRNEEGKTVLLRAIEKSGKGFNLDKMSLLLHYGATLSTEETNDLFNAALPPLVKPILEQANQPIIYPDLCPIENNVSILNFKKPILALSSFDCGNAIIQRVIVVGVSAILAGTLTACALTTAAPIFLSCVVVPLYYKWEWSRSTKAINERVINEFHEAKFPRKEATDYILENEESLDKLIAQDANLLKFDNHAENLYNRIMGRGLYKITDERDFHNLRK